MTVMALNFWRPPGSAAGLKPAPSSCPEILPPPSRRTPAPRACSALLQPAPHAPTAGCPAGGRRHRSGRPPAPHESLSARGARPRQASQALSSCAASFQKKSPPLRSSTDQRKSIPLPSRSSATSAASRVRAEAASSPRWTLGRGRAHKGGGRAASSGLPALLRAEGPALRPEQCLPERHRDTGFLAQQGQRSHRQLGWVGVYVLEDTEPKQGGATSARTGAGVRWPRGE